MKEHSEKQKQLLYSIALYRPHVLHALRRYESGACSWEDMLLALVLSLSDALEATQQAYMEHLRLHVNPSTIWSPVSKGTA